MKDAVGRRTVVRAAAATALLVVAVPALALDWPQWRGPARNGVSAETGWSTRWPAGGPRKMWSARVGEGYSTVAVAGGKVYTLGNAGGQDTIYALNAESGREVWRYSYPCSAGDYGGPRSSPAVAGNQLFTVSREGLVVCLSTTNGKALWTRNLQRELGAAPPRWGFAGSPLVEGNRVYVNIGTSGAALDRASGKVLWWTGRDASGYASPVMHRTGGRPGLAIFTATGIASVDPTTGRRQWFHPWSTSYEVNAADPIFNGSQVFISSNYGKGGALLDLAGGRPRVVWENRNMRNHFNSCVLVNGMLYGNDENTLKCVEWATGKERWRERGMGKGGLIAADGKLIVLTERGELSVLQATPNAYTVLASAKVMSGSCWSHPVLANGRIYCRNHEGELICLDVR